MINLILIIPFLYFLFTIYLYQRVKWSNLLIFASIGGEFDKTDRIYKSKKFFLSKEAIELHNKWFEFHQKLKEKTNEYVL